MFLISFTFAFVFLYGSGAVDFGNVGKCTEREMSCDSLKCKTDFIKRLQKDPKGNCSVKYKQMVACAKNTMMLCMGDSLPNSTIDTIVKTTYKEKTMCIEGTMEIPTVPPNTGSSVCPNSFSSDANHCMRSFHQKFAVDKSDPSLCTEAAKAKKCMKGVVSECNFPAYLKETLDKSYSNPYNPYCANNRDPGATGNGICDGVKDLNNPLNKASSLKNSVFQTVSLSFLLLMFFVKA